MSRRKRIEKTINIIRNVLNVCEDVVKSNIDSCNTRQRVNTIIAVYSISGIIIKNADKQLSKEVYQQIKNLYKETKSMFVDKKMIVDVMYDALTYKENEEDLSLLQKIVFSLYKLNPDELEDMERQIITKSLKNILSDFVENLDKNQEKGE